METLTRFETIYPILKYYVDEEEIDDLLNDYLETIFDEPFDNSVKINFKILETLMDFNRKPIDLERLNEAFERKELFDVFVVPEEFSENLYPIEELEKIAKGFLPSKEQIERQIEYLNSLKRGKLMK